MGELPTNGGTNLCHPFAGRPEPIQPCQQRGVERGRDRAARRWTRRQYRGDLVVALIAFEYGFGQLFDKQGHAVGTLDNLVERLAGETGIAGELLDQRGTVMLVEPVQRLCGYMRLPGPAVLKLGAKGNDDKDR